MASYTVDVDNTNQDIPTGTVDFIVGQETVCTATLTQSGAGATGHCDATTSDIPDVGDYAIEAKYSGDVNNMQTNGTAQLTISQGPTLTTFSACPATATAGQPASYTVQVSAQNGQGAMKTPTDTATLTDHSPSGSATSYGQTLAPAGSAQTAQASYSIALTGAG